MRQLDKDDAKPLGPPIRRETPKPEAKPVEVRPGIVRDKDGKLSTNIAENERAKYAHNPTWEWWKGYGV